MSDECDDVPESAPTDYTSLPPELSLPAGTFFPQAPAGPDIFAPIPPTPHSEPDTRLEKLEEALTTPPNTDTPYQSPPPDPYAHENAQAEAARQQDIDEHIFNTPGIEF